MEFLSHNPYLTQTDQNLSYKIKLLTTTEENDRADLETKNPLLTTEFQLKDKLGSGGSGQVYKIISKKNNKIFALKYVKNSSGMFKNTRNDVFRNLVLNEIIINYNVGSRYITRCLGFFAIGNSAYGLVQEYADKGNLKDYLGKFQTTRKRLIDSKSKYLISESMLGYISHYIANALKHLYLLNVIHQDIKCENLLVDQNLDIKLSDFTVSVKLNSVSSKFVFSGQGTTLYISPENLRKDSIPLNESYKTDYFSFGVFIYKFLYGSFPYNVNRSDQRDEIIFKYEHNKLEFPDSIHVSLQIKDFLIKLLKFDYKERLTINEIMEHDWIKNFSRIINIKDNYNSNDKEKFIRDLLNDDVIQLTENLNL